MDYKELTIKLIEILKKTKIPYMFTGGIASNYYGFTRATFDIDLVIGLEEKYIKPLVKRLKILKFDLKEEDIQILLEITNRFMTRSPLTEHRVDFWIPKTEFEKEAFKRRRREVLFKRRVWLVSPEDIILMKLLSWRGRDIEDVIGILTRQKERLDTNYLLHWSKILNREKELRDLQEKVKKFG